MKQTTFLEIWATRINYKHPKFVVPATRNKNNMKPKHIYKDKRNILGQMMDVDGEEMKQDFENTKKELWKQEKIWN